MRRVGIRHLLPLAAIATYLVCIAASFPDYQREVSKRRESQYAAVETRPQLPTAMVCALAVAGPAIVLGSLVALPMAKIVPVPREFIFFAIGFFVAIVWYFIGRWVDRVVGVLPRQPLRASPNFVAGHVLGILFSLPSTIFLAYVLAADPANAGAAAILLPWTTLAVLFFWERLRRYRSRELQN